MPGSRVICAIGFLLVSRVQHTLNFHYSSKLGQSQITVREMGEVVNSFQESTIVGDPVYGIYTNSEYLNSSNATIWHLSRTYVSYAV
jgi:hypothetical protein